MTIHRTQYRRRLKRAVSFVVPLAGVVLTGLQPPRAMADFREWVAIFAPPPGQGEPIDAAGGASRGCAQNSAQHIVALMPTLVPPDDGAPAIEGWTISPHPTFFFYLPPSWSESDAIARFSVTDNHDGDLYSAAIPLMDTSGIIGVTLPENAPPLEENETYRWYFSLECQSQNQPNPLEAIVLSGSIELERDPLNGDDTEEMSDLQRAVFYAGEGIWLDSLKLLADLRRSQPDDAEITQTWEALLDSAGLSEIANAPFLECCQLQSLPLERHDR